MTESLQRILAAIDGFRCGELGADEFQAEVAFFSALVHQARRAVEEEPHAGQPLALYLEGLQDIEAGLGFLEGMDDHSQSSAGETAASLIWDGSGKIQASVRAAAAKADLSSPPPG